MYPPINKQTIPNETFNKITKYNNSQRYKFLHGSCALTTSHNIYIKKHYIVEHISVYSKQTFEVEIEIESEKIKA